MLLIVWDTVRAGNLSLYGYGRRTTPNLERLGPPRGPVRPGVRDVLMDLAVARQPVHRAVAPRARPAGSRPSATAVPRSPSTSASRGYDTAGFVANLDYCGRETGLARGFAHYEDYPLDPWDIFTRYVALGRRMEVITWACALNSW